MTGAAPVSGFSRAKRRLDAAMLAAKRDDSGERRADSALDPHDLRRTAATGMARLNIPPHVVDKVLNHVSGTIRGVAAVYNGLSISRSGAPRSRHGAVTSRCTSTQGDEGANVFCVPPVIRMEV